MKYIDFSEQNGILSHQQRVGIITLLPKGTKDKRSLKNWRPITLLSTLYKIISGAIGNRFKKVLPFIIHPDQKGFVDGRQISDVTRLLFDTVTDAYSENKKKGIIMSIDFEKAFDSVSFSFLEQVIETAGFPEKLKKWVSILLNDFKSNVNHAGNLLTQINLGRGARQGDPIASILFVLAIEILLIAIRMNEQIIPYKFSKSINEQTIQSILEAYADDVNLIMPRNERSLREVILTLEKFETLSGLRVNTDKTQVLRIGRDATSDPILCPDLGLKWVSKLKILGIFISATPSEMEENLKDKIQEISDLLGKWTFRNMTVYGRIQVVKSLALSKVTHLIQVIPNPSPSLILELQKIINNFVWKGSQQKKIVVREEFAQLPNNKGGLSVPNLQCFWNSLKMSWLPKLFKCPDNTTWKMLCLSRLGQVLRIPNLTPIRLASVGPAAIAIAAKALKNQFWKDLFQKLPKVESAFFNKSPKIIGERNIWDTKDISEGGHPFKRKLQNPMFVRHFKFIRDFISPITHTLRAEDEVEGLVGKLNLPVWRKMAESITTYLLSLNVTWHSIEEPVIQPHLYGWVRLLLECQKSRQFYPLLQPSSSSRNPNEQAYSNRGLNLSESRWNKFYGNQGLLRCNLRVKYEEYRILWGRQELNRDRAKYSHREGETDTMCSYCSQEEETEVHLYTNCMVTNVFWKKAAQWYEQTFHVKVPLGLKIPRILGMDNERSSDLRNIFYRNARYCI